MSGLLTPFTVAIAIIAAFSRNLKAVNWRTVGWGMALQVGLGFAELRLGLVHLLLRGHLAAQQVGCEPGDEAAEEHRAHLARLHVQGHRVQRGETAEAHGHAVDVEPSRARRRHLRRHHRHPVALTRVAWRR